MGNLIRLTAIVAVLTALVILLAPNDQEAMEVCKVIHSNDTCFSNLHR